MFLRKELYKSHAPSVFGITPLQRFQQRKYIKYKLVKTEERGWGLLADEDVKVVLYFGCILQSKHV